MNANYIEHLEHVAGSASEFQNCLTEANAARRELARVHAARIERAISFGLCVVVESEAYYCRATDAFAGSYERFVIALPSREAAEKHAERRCLADPEAQCYVLPRLAPVAVEAAPAEVDDCPF